MIDVCASNPCKYGGLCIQVKPAYYVCKCPAGTTGLECETDIMECASSPCLNNGTCLEPSLGRYKCICPDEFKGINCENYVNNLQIDFQI